MALLTSALVILGFAMVTADIFSIISPPVVTESSVQYYLYTRENQWSFSPINISDPDAVGKSSFSNSKPTYFYIPGYQENPKFLSSAILFRLFILIKYDVNLIVVDWSSISTSLFYFSIIDHALEETGKLVGKHINSLVSFNGLDLNTTQLVGSSLGAHVVGVAGVALGGKVDQVVGIDPAGPGLTINVTKNRLTKESGIFVQGIHTSKLDCCGPSGHADYYPNGGKVQPWCSWEPIGLCSHSSSLFIYIESLFTNNFIAKQCDSYKNYKAGKCDNAPQSRMGGYNVDKTAYGTYFLDANVFLPWAKG